MKKIVALLCAACCFCFLWAEGRAGLWKSMVDIVSQDSSAVGEATGERYRFIDDVPGTDSGTVSVQTRTYLYAGMTPVSVTQNNQTFYVGTDVRGSIRTLTDRYGMVASTAAYDVFGNPETSGAIDMCGLGFAGKRYDSVSGLSDFGFRDYSAVSGRFTTEDPIRYGSNWYVYAGGDPVNYVDMWGLAPKNMSDPDRNAYIAKVKEYAGYKLENNRLDIPDMYDCADVATFLYSKATAETSLGNQAGKLLHNGSAVEDCISAMQSYDYFRMQTENVTYYDDRSFNNSEIETGTLMVWMGPGLGVEKGWVGHVATIIDVERNNAGNVTGIDMIQGHTGGNKTEVVHITDQKDLNSYLGTFLGFAEIGKDSTQPGESCVGRRY